MVALSPKDELTPAKSQASAQISLQSALLAARLQNVTKLELSNHYLNSGSIILMNGNVDDRDKAGTQPGKTQEEKLISPQLRAQLPALFELTVSYLCGVVLQEDLCVPAHLPATGQGVGKKACPLGNMVLSEEELGR